MIATFTKDRKNSINTILSSNNRGDPADNDSIDEKRIILKRKRTQYPTIPRAMHVLKKDIRRQYMLMFTNVFNSYDSNLFQSFVDTMATPSLLLKGEQDSSRSPQILKSTHLHTTTSSLVFNDKPSFTLAGKALTKFFFIVAHLLSPDQVIQIEDTKLKTYSGSECCQLISKISLKGTYFMEGVKLNQLVEQTIKLQMQQHAKQDTTQPDYTSSSDALNHKVCENSKPGCYNDDLAASVTYPVVANFIASLTQKSNSVPPNNDVVNTSTTVPSIPLLPFSMTSHPSSWTGNFEFILNIDEHRFIDEIVFRQCSS